MWGTVITSVKARQVYTNRGKPGVEVVVKTENGAEGRGMCTSGISIGTHEVDFSFDGGSFSYFLHLWIIRNKAYYHSLRHKGRFGGIHTRAKGKNQGMLLG